VKTSCGDYFYHKERSLSLSFLPGSLLEVILLDYSMNDSLGEGEQKFPLEGRRRECNIFSKKSSRIISLGLSKLNRFL